MLHELLTHSVCLVCLFLPSTTHLLHTTTHCLRRCAARIRRDGDDCFRGHSACLQLRLWLLVCFALSWFRHGDVEASNDGRIASAAAGGPSQAVDVVHRQDRVHVALDVGAEGVKGNHLHALFCTIIYQAQCVWVTRL